MANEIQALPQANQQLLTVLHLTHMAQKAYSDWCGNLPNDTFWKSHWEEIDGIDSGLMTLKCDIAALIGNDLVDHLP